VLVGKGVGRAENFEKLGRHLLPYYCYYIEFGRSTSNGCRQGVRNI